MFNEEKITSYLKNTFRIYEFSITPPKSHPSWKDVIFEARGRGIPIASFGNTQDKIVIHPGNIHEIIDCDTYDFSYFWGEGIWGSQDCWSEKESPKRRKQARFLLDLLKDYLERELKLKVLYCIPKGNEKGYLSTIVSENIEENDNAVLFVFYQN